MRRDHFETVLSGASGVDWFEAISENFMVEGGRPLDVLTRVRERFPVVLHGVSLSIGSTDPLDEAYLDRLAALAERFQPAWISDHLCWTGVGGRQAHDLLPLPYTPQALDHVVARVQRVQERLGRAIALENVSSYVAYRHSTLPEWEFLAQVSRRSGCGILLDINNIYVSARNHRFDPRAYLDGIPPDAVWTLYRQAVRRFGAVSSLIEWDDRIPSFERLVEESRRARAIHDEVLEPAPAGHSGATATTRPPQRSPL